MRRGIGPDAVEQVDLANAPYTPAISSLCAGGGWSPRAAPSAVSGEEDRRPAFAIQNRERDWRGVARPFVEPELEIRGKKTVRQRMSRSAGNKMPRTHACCVHGDRKVTDRVGTPGQREKDGRGSVAHPPIDLFFGREVVRDIRDEDHVIVFACRIGELERFEKR